MAASVSRAKGGELGGGEVAHVGRMAAAFVVLLVLEAGVVLTVVSMTQKD